MLTKVCEIVLQFKISFFYLNMFKKTIYFCVANLNFLQHYYILQCHVIHQKSFWYADLMLKNIDFYIKVLTNP